jgi:hypothetical protein
MLIIVVLAVIAGAGWMAWRRWRDWRTPIATPPSAGIPPETQAAFQRARARSEAPPCRRAADRSGPAATRGAHDGARQHIILSAS